jgi:hypothetical protein
MPQQTLIDLPPHIDEPLEVFVNGVAQRLGHDYELRGRALVFVRPLGQEGKLGFARWLMMFLGVAGTYRGHETVDVVYERDGRRLVETGLQAGRD